jgi:hypothetical protein
VTNPTTSGTTLSERESKALLAGFGVPFLPEIEIQQFPLWDKLKEKRVPLSFDPAIPTSTSRRW